MSSKKDEIILSGLYVLSLVQDKDTVEYINCNSTEMWMLMEFIKTNDPEIEYVQKSDAGSWHYPRVYIAEVQWHQTRYRMTLLRNTIPQDQITGLPHKILSDELQLAKLERLGENID